MAKEVEKQPTKDAPPNLDEATRDTKGHEPETADDYDDSDPAHVFGDVPAMRQVAGEADEEEAGDEAEASQDEEPVESVSEGEEPEAGEEEAAAPPPPVTIDKVVATLDFGDGRKQPITQAQAEKAAEAAGLTMDEYIRMVTRSNQLTDRARRDEEARREAERRAHERPAPSREEAEAAVVGQWSDGIRQAVQDYAPLAEAVIDRLPDGEEKTSLRDAFENYRPVVALIASALDRANRAMAGVSFIFSGAEQASTQGAARSMLTEIDRRIEGMAESDPVLGRVLRTEGVKGAFWKHLAESGVPAAVFLSENGKKHLAAHFRAFAYGEANLSGLLSGDQTGQPASKKKMSDRERRMASPAPTGGARGKAAKSALDADIDRVLRS